MTLIVLAAICLLGCAFLLFVLFQWTRDTKRKTTTRTAVDHAAGSSKAGAVSRAVAGLDATGANGLLTRKSQGR